jgi:hypothetical protein
MLEIDGRFLRSSSLHRPRVNSVRVIHHEKHPSGGCTDRSGNEALRTLANGGDPESSLADRQLSDDLFAVAHQVQDAGSESLLIERDCRRPLVDPSSGCMDVMTWESSPSTDRARGWIGRHGTRSGRSGNTYAVPMSR